MTKKEAATEIVAINQEIVMPAVSADQALEAWEAYQSLKNKILDPSTDIQQIQGKEFKKKSYWRKVATFFNLSIETKYEHHEQIGRTLVWHFTVRAVAPNGRFADGVGSCDVYEKAMLVNGAYQVFGKPATPNSLHNVRSTAFTRAFNRAVSDLVGGGEVSAEEVDQHPEGITLESNPVGKNSSTTYRSTSSSDEDMPCEFPECPEFCSADFVGWSQRSFGKTYCRRHSSMAKNGELNDPKENLGTMSILEEDAQMQARAFDQMPEEDR